MDDGGSDGGESDAADATIVDVRVPTCSERFDGGFDGGALIFCDDFERDLPFGAGWLTLLEANGGTLSTSTLHARSGARSLLAEVPGGENPSNKNASLISRDFDAGGFPVVIEMDLLAEIIPEYADAPYNGFVFGAYKGRRDGGDVEALLYAGVSGTGLYNPYVEQSNRILTVPLGAWRHVVLTIDNQLTTLDVLPDEDAGTVPRAHAFRLHEPPHRIWVGVDVGLNGGPVRLFVDDVVVHH